MSSNAKQHGKDFATGKSVDLSKPEEAVRQEYEQVLVDNYGYRKTELGIEVAIPRGSGHFSDKADIVVYQPGRGRDPARHILGIVETKKPARKDGIGQLKSYMTATSAVWGVWTNGDDIAYLCRQGNEIREDYLNNIPTRGQSVEDVGRLTKDDLRSFGRGELKSAFRRILRTLYSNTSISRREKLGSEMIKIIFSKIQDEKTYLDRPPEFRAEAGENPREVAKRIKNLFGQVRKDLEDDGIFRSNDTIELDDRSLAWVVGQLERGSLLSTDSDVVGDAFEVFSESKFIGEKGEFFTPRGVVRIAVKLTDPTPGDKICDPACGSGGFLIHAMKHVWSAMELDPKWRNAPNMADEKRSMATRSIYGIDKEPDLVKIAKAHMAIAGDGRSNIVHENSLHDADEFIGEAKTRFVKDGDFRHFDVILTNPPFGTKVKVLETDAAKFALGCKWKETGEGWERTAKTVKRDPYVLFIERSLGMLKNGGVLGIILPETVFHAPTLGYLRQFILRNNNLVSVIDLPHNTFRPHCNAKTCLLVLRKGERQQQSVVMGTPKEMGHDHQGREMNRPGTDDVWDDLKEVAREIDAPKSKKNKHVFSVNWPEIVSSGILVPRFYRGLSGLPDMPRGRHGVRLEELVESGAVTAWDGHGSPKGESKGRGPIPYIRVSDIVNWELYRNPVSSVPEEEYERLTRNKQKPMEGDVIFVRRGSYRIGTVAMASPRDGHVLLTRELLTLRVADKQNDHNMSPFYLLFLLSSQFVQDQMDFFVFMDTTMPTIGDRWKHLVLPIHSSHEDAARVSAEVEKIVRKKWLAQSQIDHLRSREGGITT